MIVEHLHPSIPVPGAEEWARKAKWDETYEDANLNEHQVADLKAWNDYRACQLWDDITRVRDTLERRP